PAVELVDGAFIDALAEAPDLDPGRRAGGGLPRLELDRHPEITPDPDIAPRREKRRQSAPRLREDRQVDPRLGRSDRCVLAPPPLEEVEKHLLDPLPAMPGQNV